MDIETFEPEPGRTSLVAKIEGSDPSAPSLTLLGHTDVVPANGDDWSQDPFGGELIDGEVWGRGAIDMLNLTATMATGFRHLADSGFRPAGDLTYIAVADEEALGTHGAGWLCQHAADDVNADYVITESGGFPMGGADGTTRLPVIVGEKGVFWCILTVRGTPGHGSQPLRTDNALVKAAEVVRRIDAYRPPAQLHEAWVRFIEGIGFPPEIAEPLLDPDRIDDFCDELPLVGLARQAHACTHTTMAPTIMRTGSKINVIPDRVELEVDIRSLPGWETARRAGHAGGSCSAIWPTTSTSGSADRAAVDHLAHRHPAVGCLGAGQPAVLPRSAHGALPDRGSHRCPVPPGARAAWPTDSASTAGPSGSSSTGRCSTGSTSGSTSSRCACPPRCGSPWPTTSWSETRSQPGRPPRRATEPCARAQPTARLSQVVLFQPVQRRAPGGRAGRLRPAHMTQGVGVPEKPVEPAVHEVPRPHVLGLLLEPDHLPGVGIAVRGRPRWSTSGHG